MQTYAMVVVVVVVAAVVVALRRIGGKWKYWRIYRNLAELANEEVAELSASADYGEYAVETARMKVVRYRWGAWYYRREMQDMSRFIFTVIAAMLTPLMLAFIINQVDSRFPDWKLVGIILCLGVAFGFGWLVRTWEMRQFVQHEIRRRIAAGNWPYDEEME